VDGNTQNKDRNLLRFEKKRGRKRSREREKETVLKRGNPVTFYITSVELKLIFNVSQREIIWALSKQQEDLNLPHFDY